MKRGARAAEQTGALRTAQSRCGNGGGKGGHTTPKVGPHLARHVPHSCRAPAEYRTVLGIWLAPSVFNPLSPPAPSSTSTTLTVDPHVDEFSLRYSHPSPPFLTLIGSSNYGSRSAARDLEAGVLLTTHNSTLRWALENEVRLIRKYADVLVDRKMFEKPDRKVPWGVRMAANAIETML